jgi:hypothetical protein
LFVSLFFFFSSLHWLVFFPIIHVLIMKCTRLELWISSHICIYQKNILDITKMLQCLILKACIQHVYSHVYEYNEILIFSNISAIIWRSVLLVEETGENHPNAACHWQTLSHNIESRLLGYNTDRGL